MFTISPVNGSLPRYNRQNITFAKQFEPHYEPDLERKIDNILLGGLSILATAGAFGLMHYTKLSEYEKLSPEQRYEIIQEKGKIRSREYTRVNNCLEANYSSLFKMLDKEILELEGTPLPDKNLSKLRNNFLKLASSSLKLAKNTKNENYEITADNVSKNMLIFLMENNDKPEEFLSLLQQPGKKKNVEISELETTNAQLLKAASHIFKAKKIMANQDILSNLNAAYGNISEDNIDLVLKNISFINNIKQDIAARNVAFEELRQNSYLEKFNQKHIAKIVDDIKQDGIYAQKQLEILEKLDLASINNFNVSQPSNDSEQTIVNIRASLENYINKIDSFSITYGNFSNFIEAFKSRNASIELKYKEIETVSAKEDILLSVDDFSKYSKFEKTYLAAKEQLKQFNDEELAKIDPFSVRIALDFNKAENQIAKNSDEKFILSLIKNQKQCADSLNQMVSIIQKGQNSLVEQKRIALDKGRQEGTLEAENTRESGDSAYGNVAKAYTAYKIIDYLLF